MESVDTSGPRVSTTPDISWPRMTGPGLPLTIGSISPRQKWRSEPHMPPDVIFVRIPPGPTGAGGSSVISK